MATSDEIIRAFKLILGAGLDYPPTKDEIPDRLDTWCEMLTDIPGPILLTAAKDIVLKAERFPSIPRVIEAAKQVAAHNNTSAASTPFQPLGPVGKPEPRMWRVKGGQWHAIELSHAPLSDAKQQAFYAEYLKMLDNEPTPPPDGYATWREWYKNEVEETNGIPRVFEAQKDQSKTIRV